MRYKETLSTSRKQQLSFLAQHDSEQRQPAPACPSPSRTTTKIIHNPSDGSQTHRYLQAVQKCLGDRVNLVRRRHEQHRGEVERQVQIVVRESVVLLRVEHFQEGGRGVSAPDVGADLVHLVQEENGIAGAGAAQAADDAARHGTDVGPPVAADLGLVVHASQRKALKPSGLCVGVQASGLERGGYSVQETASHIRLVASTACRR